jgi:hypothetical protein
MIVSHRHKYVFIHIPKTAGTSIQKALGLRTDAHGGWVGDQIEMIGATKHHFSPDHIPSGYFVFTFVRNPWDRLLSYYMFRREPRNRHRLSIHPMERKITYLEWLHRLPEFSAYRRINPAFQIAISSQSDIIGDYPDFVGRFETLTQDCQTLLDRLGIENPGLENVNPTTSKQLSYQQYYDDECKSFIADRYRDDIDRFGFEF